MSQTTNSMIMPRRAQQEGNREDDDVGLAAFAPSLVGYFSLEFSLYFPEFSNDMEALTQQNTNVIVERLDSLMLMFLCSRNVDLVISANPDSVMSVCPFQDNIPDEETGDSFEGKEMVTGTGDNVRRALVSMLKGMASSFRRLTNGYSMQNPTGMVLWNFPKVEHEVVLLRNVSVDMERSINGNGDTYYTLWMFTYPVNDWGTFVEGDSDQYIQDLLDDSIVSGTFAAVLPWEDVDASVVGEELPTFFNLEAQAINPDVDVVSSSPFDNEIPASTARLLQGIGSIMVFLNAVVVIILTVLARRSRVCREAEDMKRAADSNDRNRGLGTEEGVSEMLLESKMFAMEKSKEFSTSEEFESNVSPANASEKEQKLCDKTLNLQPIYSGKLLANLSMEDDDDDDNLEDVVDFCPPSFMETKPSGFEQGPSP